METAITPNLLLIKNTLSQLPGQDALTVGEGSPVLSLAKPALQSDEGSKKTASGALRNTFFGRRVLGKAGLGHDSCQVSWRVLCPGLAGARRSQNAPVKQVGACFAGDVAPTLHPAAPEGREGWSREGQGAGVKVAGSVTPQCPCWAIIPPTTSSLGSLSPKPGLRLAEAPRTVVEGKTEVPDPPAPTLRPSQAGAAQRGRKQRDMEQQGPAQG